MITRGDIFADLGFSPAEADNLHVRSQLMTALREFIENQCPTRAEAASVLT